MLFIYIKLSYTLWKPLLTSYLFTGFCRDAMFSITSEYNSGALSCFCDFMGSTELECNTFGGQCPCKENVIGRTCTSCRTGYYGFPNCRPCHCPATAICDENGNIKSTRT